MKKAQVHPVLAVIILIFILYLLNNYVQSKEITIKIDANGCQIPNLNIKKDTTVKWINTEQITTQLDFTGMTNPPVRVTLPQGSTYSLKFDKVGIYTYNCVNRLSQIIVS